MTPSSSWPGMPRAAKAICNRCTAQVAQAGLQHQVRLVGHVEDMAAAYLAAHVTVVASTEPEAFGRAAIEAAAMGSPVIATAIGAPPETVLAEPAVGEGCHHRAGWCRPAMRRPWPSGWRLHWRSTRPSGRPWPGGRGPHVLAQFTVEAMQRRTLAVYDRLLGTLLERRFAESRGRSRQPQFRDNLDLRYYLSDSLPACVGRPCRRTRAPVQQPMETATYVAQCEPRLSARHPVRG